MEKRYIVTEVNDFYYVHDTFNAIDVNIIGYADRKQAEEIAANMNTQYNDRVRKKG